MQAIIGNVFYKRLREGSFCALLIAIFLLFLSPVMARASFELEIDDPLTTGQSAGMVHGGSFTQQGWKTLTQNDYIQYDITTCPYGRIEFDVSGLFASNDVFPNISYDKSGEPFEDVHYTLFNMWDRDDDGSWFGQYMPSGVRQWHNPYKVLMHLFGYTAGDRYKWKNGRFRLNVSAFEGGYEDDPHAFEIAYGPIDWQKDHVYHMKIEWGNGHMYYYVDGQLMVHCDYSSFGEEYAPPDHSLRIGSANGCKGFHMQTPLLITFSNFKFYRNEDREPPSVLRHSPGDGSSGNRLDPYIAVTFSEGVDLDTAETAFSIRPGVPGTLKSAGSTIYFEPDGLLAPETAYTVRIGTELTDKAGNHLSDPFEFAFSTDPRAQTRVEKYGIFELPIVAEGISGNKYTGAWLKGTFHGPTKTIVIDGFWDGGDLWKIRMAPTEVGTWNYTITGSSSAFERSGSFECVPSSKKGFIRVNPDHPYTFMTDDGSPWMWKGDTSWRGMLNSIPFEGRWKPYIDRRASQGFNAVQSILVSYIRGDSFWSNEGGPVFELTGDGKDYDHLNPGYFKWVDRRIEYALSKGVVPVLFFTWAQEFAKFSERQFENYEKYLVSRYAAYNVIWCISGEYNEVYEDFGLSPDVWDHHGRVIQGADPYDHLITLHPTGRTSSAEFAREAWFGFIMQQMGVNPHGFLLRDRNHGKPVVNGEYGYAGYVADDDVLHGAWQIVTAGGFFTAGFFTTFAPDKGGWDLDGNSTQADWLSHLFGFMVQTRWQGMEPRDDLVEGAYCLAKEGEEYIVYSEVGGSFSIDLSGAQGTFDVYWMNPRTGEYFGGGAIAAGGRETLSAPFSGEAVAHIGKKPAASSCDVNGDGSTDILDIQVEVGVILGSETDPAVLERGDLNGDGAANVLDLQQLVDCVLNQQ